MDNSSASVSCITWKTGKRGLLDVFGLPSEDLVVSNFMSPLGTAGFAHYQVCVYPDSDPDQHVSLRLAGKVRYPLSYHKDLALLNQYDHYELIAE